jgi:general transcription factor IIIA
MHHAITHLGRRDFVCTVEGCGRAFGYKHILQRHQARTHVNDRAGSEGDGEGAQHADADGESSEVEHPQPKKPKIRHDLFLGSSTIDEITGVAYAERATGKRAQLKCPYPAMEGLISAMPVESTGSRDYGGPCGHVFGRAYDLRRHLRAVHSVALEKDVLDGWARAHRRMTGPDRTEIS